MIHRKYQHESHMFNPGIFQVPTFDKILCNAECKERLLLKDILHSQGPSSRTLTSFHHSLPERHPFHSYGPTNTTSR